MCFSFILPIVIFTLIIIHGFFANSEMAMVSSNKIRLKHMANTNNNAKIIQNLLDKPERLFGTTLVAINIATVASSTLADFYFNEYFLDKILFIQKYIPTEIIILLTMAPLTLIFGELFPMSIARKYPNTTSLRNAKLIKAGYILLFPFMIITSFISKIINYIIFGSKNIKEKITREELELMVTGRFSSINNKTQEYIKDFFAISDLNASDVMAHLNKVKAITENSTVKELKKIIKSSSHSRIPVYKNDIFNITGTVHAVNILGADEKDSISQYTDKLYIIPSSKPILQILSDFKRNRKYMGIVVDEYGVASGILTLEDILEEIVGEINDEFDIPESDKTIESENIFDASIKLDEFFEQTNIDLRNENAETLGGIINLAAGRIVRTNEKIFYKNLQFEIVEATDRVVKSIRLIKPHN